MQRYASFYPYMHQVWITADDGHVYEMPVNLDTIARRYGRSITPQRAAEMLRTFAAYQGSTSNLEEAAIARVGPDLYHDLIRGYTIKHWGRDPRELPASIISRLPVRTTRRSGYFNDRYQGVPEDGYDAMFGRMLAGADVELGCEVTSDDVDGLRSRCDALVWTGAIDEFFGHAEGPLSWRSIRIETEVMAIDDYQGCGQMNFASLSVPWTRKHEPKHYRPDRSTVPGKTIVQTEYPGDDAHDPAYPVRGLADMEIASRYKALAAKEPRVIFGGRLASYAYYDMHQVVAQALHAAAAFVRD
jgi:UDP-galactopyranose mutase